MQTIDDFNFSGKKALVRVDFNVPLDKQKFTVTDDTRMRAALPTISKILNDNGSVVLTSHLGRPEAREEKYSLKHIVAHLSELVGRTVKFAPDCIGAEALQMKKDLKPGEVLLLENVRYYADETAKDKAVVEAFAKQLAEGCDVYVNDAFGSAHRAHASTAVVAKFFPGAKFAGYLLRDEVKSIKKTMDEGLRPFTAIMGGAKVSDKIKVINNLIAKVDNLIIGGAMTYTFIKAQGGKIGTSLCEEDKLDLALDILAKAKANNVKIILPVDNVIADNFANDANTKITKIDEVEDGYKGLDIGPESIKLFTEVIENSATVLWNGPMGVFEMPNFQAGTLAIAKAVAAATQKGAFSLIGGGDSVAAINKFNLTDQVSYVSTGGGAMLEALEGITLPGVKALAE